MKTKNKFLLLPDEELHRLEEKYGYTNKTDVLNEVRQTVTDHTSGAYSGDAPAFHVFEVASEIEEKVTNITKKATSNKGATITSRPYAAR